MATLHVQKVATGDNTLGGLKSSRYEKMQVSYGVIAEESYEFGDTLSFGVPSADIIEAEILVHSGSPQTLKVYPGTDISEALTMYIVGRPKISYVIKYIRGAGLVAGATGGDLLRVTLLED